MKKLVNHMCSRKIQGAIASLVICVLGSFGCTSCTIESSDNGKLDGFWHLESVDTLSNGKTEDFSEKYVFWGIEHKLISVKDTETNREKFYFRFEQTSDSLKITKVYKNHWHQDKGEEGGDIPVEEIIPDLQFYGINSLPEGFQKEALDGSKMILKSKKIRLRFRKF